MLHSLRQVRAEHDGDDPESVKRLVAEAEAVFERLEKRLKAVNQGVKAEKAGKVEL